MELLTTTGYKPIEDVTYDDLLVAYDVSTGNIIYNHLEKKELWTKDDQGVLHDLDWVNYRVNDTWTIFKYQSIWVNDRLAHGSDLNVGDYVYNDQDQPVQIYKIEEVEKNEWWRLKISGDHSYIADNLSLHNADRYWVGGGSSVNWNATANTNWSTASGGANNASVPTSVDAVIFDGNGVNANGNNTVSASITVLSFRRESGFTATISVNANNLNITGDFILDSGSGFTWAGSGRLGFGGVGLGGTIVSGNKVVACNLIWNAGTFTLSGGNDFVVTGSIATANGNNTINRTTAEKWIFGSVSSINFSFLGTAEVIFTGTSISVQGFANNFYISAATPSTNVSLTSFIGDGGTMTLSRGILVPAVAASTIQVRNGNQTFDLSGSPTLRNFTFSVNNRTATFISPIFFSGTTTIVQNSRFSGTGDFTTSTFTSTSDVSNTLTLSTGSTLSITGSMSLAGSRIGSQQVVASESATERARLILFDGATCTVCADFTRIDASGGRVINTFSGDVTNCINVRNYTDIPTKANTYFIN